MDEKLTFKYDRDADILYINTRPPYGRARLMATS
jgi:uncharacterized protein YuzE